MDPFPLEPYRSARLLYRAPEDNAEDDAFFIALYNDPSIFSMASHSLQCPRSIQERKELRKTIENMMFMSVVICIIPDDKDKEPETIGVISLKSQPPVFVHNRTHEFGITIARQYQGKGYGPEAISWLLDWSFLTAGLHRVELTVFEWNERARKVYEKVGFVTEGRRRQCLWKEGRWWDAIHMGILSDEWAKKKITSS
ncbi:hypothetical protein N7486_004734 [Penicillium sp. IBT 16267x]|nr:hypothetical protein N7486_004734 [Penicillium sp. IBT 16267x]